MAPWVRAYLRWQTMTNTLASVAIEIPALRPMLERRIIALDGPSQTRLPGNLEAATRLVEPRVEDDEIQGAGTPREEPTP